MVGIQRSKSTSASVYDCDDSKPMRISGRSVDYKSHYMFMFEPTQPASASANALQLQASNHMEESERRRTSECSVSAWSSQSLCLIHSVCGPAFFQACHNFVMNLAYSK